MSTWKGRICHNVVITACKGGRRFDRFPQRYYEVYTYAATGVLPSARERVYWVGALRGTARGLRTPECDEVK